MQNHVLQLKCPPIPVVKIGFIGLGNRGIATLKRYTIIKGAEIVALCDLREHNLQTAREVLLSKNNVAAREYTGTEGWKELCEDPCINLIYICTDWQTHEAMATYAMQQGKHVAIEVPAAMTVKECWNLVNTAEENQRHCFMLENCCFDPFALVTLNMAKQRLFGEITHCEGAYIHDLRDRYDADENNGGYHNGWMEKYCNQHVGNPYPTHGLGPICQLLNIHRGDRMDYLISMSSTPIAKQNAESQVNINNTLIKTVLGKSILIQYDVTTPRPYSRLQTVCGTKGYAQKYPRRCFMFDEMESLKGDAVEEYLEKYAHPITTEIRKDARLLNVPNEMNYIMDRRLIYCLQKGIPLDIDVYDAAEWSCITELSELSVKNGGTPIQIPDFTRGRWNMENEFKFAE